jgi:threonine aldolase
MKIIDLRSDTVTKPSKEMLNAMINSELGDDVYFEDPTVNLLQDKVSKLFGFEAGLFTPTGTMANQIALLVNTNSGDEIICESDSHIFYYETSAPSILARVQIRCIDSDFGEMPLDKIRNAIRDEIYYLPKTSLICLENTHNRHGGTIISQEYIKKVKQIADNNNIRMHLDGARIWNAHKATNIPLKQMAEGFNTISVCFSKGLGTPAGSMILGSKEDIKKAIKWRKILGGGLRQVGLLAGACLFALENNLEKIGTDNDNAKYFANELRNSSKIELNRDFIHTNIVTFKIDEKINPDVFVTKCKHKGILLMHIGQNKIRTVVHLDLDREMLLSASKIIKQILEEL